MFKNFVYLNLCNSTLKILVYLDLWNYGQSNIYCTKFDGGIQQYKMQGLTRRVNSFLKLMIDFASSFGPDQD